MTEPDCTLTVDPNNGDAPLTTTFDASMDSWVRADSLSFGDGQMGVRRPTFSVDHVYNSV